MSFRRFQEYLDDKGFEHINPLELDKATHTAEDAARVNDVQVSNIVKSLFLVSDVDEIIVLVPGDRKLDIEKLSEHLGVPYNMSDADTVKDLTGYSIGGVPPFGHKQKFCTYIVKGFDRKTELLAAAGSSNTVFKTDYKTLTEICDAVELPI